MSLLKPSSEYFLSHDSRPKFQSPLDYFTQTHTILRSPQTIGHRDSPNFFLTTQNCPMSLEESELMMVESSKKIKKDTSTNLPNLSLQKVNADKNCQLGNKSYCKDDSANITNVLEAPIFPHQSRPDLKNTQPASNIINIDDDEEDDCIIIEDNLKDSHIQLPQDQMIQTNRIQFPEYLNTMGMSQHTLPFQNVWNPLSLLQPIDPNPLASLLQQQILMNYIQGIAQQRVLENSETDRNIYASTLNESKQVEMIVIDEDDFEIQSQSNEMIEGSPEEKQTAYQIKKSKRRPKVERNLNIKRNFEEIENEPKRRLIGRPKKQIEKFELFDVTDPNPVEISTTLQVPIPKFELNRKRIGQRKLKSVWNPDNIPRNLLENYFNKLEGKLESEITNEEAQINFLGRFNMNTDKALEYVDNDVAFYKRFFRLTRKRTQKNYYTLQN